MVTCVVHWQEPSKLRAFDRPIVCATAKHKILSFKTCRGEKEHWDWLVNKYNITYWAFQSEVLPFY